MSNKLHVKITFYTKQIEFNFGIEINAEGMEQRKRKPVNLKDYLVFMDIQIVRSLCPHCQIFLTELLKNNIKYHWDEERDKTFRYFKSHLCNSSLLKFINLERLLK